MNKISKARLIGATSLLSGHNQQVVREVHDATYKVIAASLANGVMPYLLGLGKLSVMRREAREGRDIRRGMAVMVSARNVLSFRPSAPLKAAVNAHGAMPTTTDLIAAQ